MVIGAEYSDPRASFSIWSLRLNFESWQIYHLGDNVDRLEKVQKTTQGNQLDAQDYLTIRTNTFGYLDKYK